MIAILVTKTITYKHKKAQTTLKFKHICESPASSKIQNISFCLNLKNKFDSIILNLQNNKGDLIWLLLKYLKRVLTYLKIFKQWVSKVIVNTSYIPLGHRT